MSNSVLKFGAQWLGQLPDGWDQLRARYLFTERKEKSTKNDTHLTPSQKYAVLPQDEYMKRTGNRVVLNLTGSDNMKHVEEGDFVIHLRSFQGGIEYSGYTGKVSNAYTVLEPKDNVDSGFFKHVLKSHGFISELSRTTDQLRDGQSIKFSQLDLLEFPSPKPITQQKIADFLDQETAKIDNLIAKQERLLELLEEKRRATITHAVTRGLNPNVQLKETNIPWLIRAPEHFTMISMRYMLTFLTDYTANGSFASLAKNVNYLDEGFARLVRLTDLRKGLKNDGIYVDEDAYNFLGKSKLFKNDLLIANVGHYTGFVCKMPSCESPATLGPNMFLMRFDKSRYNNDFLEYILNTSYVQDQLKIKSSSAAQPKINKDQLRSTIVFMPEINEQNKIVELLNENGRKTDTLKQKIQTQIALLRERRTSLISHAVTGKIKV